MVSKAGLSNPTRRSSASMSPATSRSRIPAKAFGIIHLAASESLPAASRSREISHEPQLALPHQQCGGRRKESGQVGDSVGKDVTVAASRDNARRLWRTLA